MKNIVSILLFPLLAAAQTGDLTFPGGLSESQYPLYRDYSRVDFGQPSYFTMLPNCEPFEEIGLWEVENEGDTAAEAAHECEWVFAEHDDVNTRSDITLADYTICGRPTTTVEAKICRVCLRHERRTITRGERPAAPPKSEYQLLLEKIKSN